MDISHIRRIARHNMEICHKALARHTDRADVGVEDIVVDNVALGEDMDDFFAWV